MENQAMAHPFRSYSFFAGMKTIATLSAGAILLGSCPAFAQSVPAVSSQPDCQFFSTSQRYNTQSEGDVIVIGAQSNQRYRVIVESQSAETLAAIRACVVDAFLTRSTLGTYINVGSFDRRGEADTIRRILRRSGYPARTIYIRSKHSAENSAEDGSTDLKPANFTKLKHR